MSANSGMHVTAIYDDGSRVSSKGTDPVLFAWDRAKTASTTGISVTLVADRKLKHMRALVDAFEAFSHLQYVSVAFDNAEAGHWGAPVSEGIGRLRKKRAAAAAEEVPQERRRRSA